MPSAWNRKDERQYRHIYRSCREGTSHTKGKSASTCKRIAAATVNKRRAAQGRTKTRSRCSCPRGYRALKSNPSRCFRPGKAKRSRICK